MNHAQALALAQQSHRAGRYAEAAALYREVLQRDPQSAAALFCLGAACQDLGQLPEAAASYQRLAALTPANPEVFHQLALVYHRQGRLADAAAAYRQELRLRPGHAEAHNNLGVALKALGDTAEAVACYREALRLCPRYPEAHNNLGVALKEQGELDAAVHCYRRAIEFNPAYPAAHNNLGNALRQLGRAQDALAAYEQALTLAPGYADAHYNRGAALLDLRRPGEAEAALRRALELRPAFPEAWNNLGNALQQQDRPADAAAAYRHALRLRPGLADAAYNLGNALRDHGDVDQAVAAFRQVLQHRAADAPAHNNLAHALEEQGQFDDARAHALEALRLRPDWAPPLFTLAELAVHGHYTFPDAQVRRMEELLDAGGLSDDDASQLYFALALLREKAGAYDQAFAAYRQGNACKRRRLQELGQAFDPQAHRGTVDALITAFDAAFFARVRESGSESQLPIFIVGMPRSGTTLVEQILAAHPHVFGAGELRAAGRLASGLAARLGATEGYPRCAARLDAPTLRALAQEYLAELAQRGGAAHRVTDKAMQSFLHLGLLTALFPHARVIHCRRDPYDVCVSCYLQYFRELNFTWDLGDLGTYYRDYHRLMLHWHQVLPRQPLEVDYEALVADPQAVSRRMVAFCGLEWDERCLAFYRHRRPVQTMSKLQVRQPVYTGSVGRWRHYAAHLQPLRAVLGAEVHSEKPG